MLVLVVEDNRDVAENIIDYLAIHNIECDYSQNGDFAQSQIEQYHYDAIILDIQLPGQDGYSLCRMIRAQGLTTPVLMLTAKDTLPDKLAGFNAGTDDYLIKPFALAELHARMLALTKRHNCHIPPIQIADLTVDVKNHQATRNNQALKLNKSCWKLLVLLAKNSPNVVSKTVMEHTLWSDYQPDSSPLRAHLYNLRTIIDKPFNKQLLHTIHGVGNALRINDSKDS